MLVSYKVLTIKKIASVDTWVETLPIFLGHGYRNSHLLKFQANSLIHKPDNEGVDLA